MTILICYFIEPISVHTYNLKAISSFYLIKSRQYTQIFGKQEMNKILSIQDNKLENSKDIEERVVNFYDNHQFIKFS